MTWVRLSKEGDSVLIGSRTGMAIHFRLDISELRPLGRTARGVKSMNLREGDNLVSMDVLTSDLVDQLSSVEGLTKEIDENLEINSSDGPWVLIAINTQGPSEELISRFSSISLVRPSTEDN